MLETIESKRAHDLLYLKEDYINKPKEVFKFVCNAAKETINFEKELEILDIGCACGEYIYYMREVYPQHRYTGLDVVPELLMRANSNNPACNFVNANIDSGENLPEKKFDVIFMSGVHSIFDDHNAWLKNTIQLAKKDATIFIFGLFNPYPHDMIMRVRGSSNDGDWQPGWNIISQKTTEDYLRTHGYNVKFHEFEIPFDVEKHEDDYLRAWTVMGNDDKRYHMNGAGIVLPFYLAEISRAV